MQRNFEPMRKQVEAWQRSELTNVTAKVVIYEAFVEGELEAPKHLARTVHDLYFEPQYEEFGPRTNGVFGTRLHPRSRNSSQSHNSRPQLSWASSLRRGSHNRSSLPGGVGPPPFYRRASRGVEASPELTS